MADFRARILAELDEQRVQPDLDRIGQNHTLTLRNLAVDQNSVNNVIRQIQRSLDNHQFNININFPNIQNQSQQAGNNAGNGFSRGMRQGISNILNNTQDEIQRMQNILHNMNFDNNSIDVVTRDLDRMNLSISRIITNIDQNGNIRLTVRGIDEFGDVVTQIRRFENNSGSITNLGKTIAQSFDTGEAAARAFREETQYAYSRMRELNKEYQNLRIAELKLDPRVDITQLEELHTQIEQIENEYHALYELFNERLTPFQQNNLWQDGLKLNSALYRTDAKIEDSARLERERETANALQDSYDELYATAKEISKLQIDIAKIDPTSGEKEIAVLTEKLKRLVQAYDDIQQSINGSLSPEQLGNLSKIVYDTNDELNRLAAKAADKKGALATASQIGNLDNKMAVWLSKNSKAAKDYGASIEALRNRIKELSSSGEMLEADLKSIEQEFKDVTAAATLAGKTGKSFADIFQSSFERITQYITIDRLFEHFVDALKGMASNVYDIDTAMTGLKKVTDETSERYDRFLKNSAASAKELKRSISSIVEQTAEWTKLGYSLDEAEELAKLSSVYANVADVTDSTAVSDMVSTMKAFSLETEDAVTIIDSMNQLGNQFATDAASLGEGLSRAASSMNVAGSDLYETLAMLTGGAEITQNAAEFGNFLKVASMRIRGMAGELESLGEEVDDSVESISKVQTQILNLTHGKVNIFDDQGEFRNYYEIMKEIADVMDDLTSTEQASLTELLFGKQRGNQGAALIQAFQSGQIEKAYKSAINSAGSAMAEQSRWAESLEADILPHCIEICNKNTFNCR